MSIDPKNIEVIMGWSDPTNVTKLRIFMGLVGYYWCFIKVFSRIANPMTSL